MTTILEAILSVFLSVGEWISSVNIAPRLNTLAVLSWTPSSRLVEQCRRHKLNTIVGIVVH